MFCANCGKEFLVEAKFCAHCGVQVCSVLQSRQEVTSKAETSALRAAYNSAGQAVNRAASTAGNFVSTVATQVGDLNGDGKIDAEDFKIAAARVKGFAIAATDEAAKLGKDALQSDLVKDAAAGAAVGAAVAIPIPFIGPIGGAAVGAVLGAYKNVTKK